MESSFKINCYRHKLLGNKLCIIEVTSNKIIITNISDLPNKRNELDINYNLFIDFKVKNKQLQAIGLITNKHHWYYADNENLINLKQILGARVVFKGVNTLYNPLQQIGQGTFSNVYLLQSKTKSYEYYACKCLDKAQVDEQIGRQGLFEEVKAMVSLKHQNIAELLEVFEGDVSYYMVMQYYDLEFIDILNDLNDEDIHIIFKQLVTAVNFMHEKGYMHRDLKPENIMFSDSIYQLKLIDFGLTTKDSGRSKCGTPGYIAPEILNFDTKINEYNEKCDIFSLGVIFYKMLTQNDLFNGSNHDEILENNAKCITNFDLLNGNPKISKQAINLLKLMLQIDPTLRIDSNSILKHEYFGVQEITLNNTINSANSLSRKHSSVIKILSPLQKKNFIFNSPFSFHDDECIEKEASMQPIPIMVMKGGSVHDITKYKNSGKNRKLSKDTTKKYQTTDFDDIIADIKQNNNYRPPKPNQLQEMYNE
ncbi:unnamed protein product [Paramecium pentaurelia]|uniref:Protein kinase domain-containing protein n=1 Tax=Paramecium pentaurelia TaxID=43138 RepID=A0A8S1YNC1_9CILI|nr:unnamed protein product [Paramecium pentaurelia]